MPLNWHLSLLSPQKHPVHVTYTQKCPLSTLFFLVRSKFAVHLKCTKALPFVHLYNTNICRVFPALRVHHGYTLGIFDKNLVMSLLNYSSKALKIACTNDLYNVYYSCYAYLMT